jgi:hypothetical protein
VSRKSWLRKYECAESEKSRIARSNFVKLQSAKVLQKSEGKQEKVPFDKSRVKNHCGPINNNNINWLPDSINSFFAALIGGSTMAF